MNRIALIAAVVALGAAPAFAATPSTNNPPANPPSSQASAHPATANGQASQQVQLDQRQAKIDRQQEQIDHQQAQLDQNSMQQGQSNQGNATRAMKTANANTDNNGAQTRHMRALQERSAWRANQETKALNMLEAQGFTRFRDFRPAGKDVYAANVVHYGRNMTVDVHPQTDRITAAAG